MGPLRVVRFGRLIRSVPLFAHCTTRQVAAIAALSYRCDFPQGEELTREGEPGRFFYVVLGGTASARRGDELLRTLNEGDFFGEIALLAHSARTATVTADTPLATLVVPAVSYTHLTLPTN